jgi:hypothetical protein
MIKAEIAQVDVSNMHFWVDQLSLLKERFQKIRSSLAQKEDLSHEPITINDSDIVSLSKDLKTKDIKVSDIFWEDSSSQSKE